jgi:hypothetical protein
VRLAYLHQTGLRHAPRLAGQAESRSADLGVRGWSDPDIAPASGTSAPSPSTKVAATRRWLAAIASEQATPPLT